MEHLSQEQLCKMNAIRFLKEREDCNNNYSFLWSYKYLGVILNHHKDIFEFKCGIIYKDIPICYPNLRYVSTVVSVNNHIGEAIIDTLVKRWKNIKNEDENENDTLSALILGIMRLEARGGEMTNIIPNYLVIHEAIVSPHQYDIETKRNERASILGMSSLQPCFVYNHPHPCSMRGIGINWLNALTTSVGYIIDASKNCTDDTLYKQVSLLKYK